MTKKEHDKEIAYLQTEVQQIHDDYEASDKRETLDDFAALWIKRNAIKFAEYHHHHN